MPFIMILASGEGGTILSDFYDAFLKDFFTDFMDHFFAYSGVMLGAFLVWLLYPRIIYEVKMLLDFYRNSD